MSNTDINIARYFGSSIVLGDSAFIIGGEGNDSTIQNFLKIHLSSNDELIVERGEWGILDINTAFEYASAAISFSINGQGFFGTGRIINTPQNQPTTYTNKIWRIVSNATVQEVLSVPSEFKKRAFATGFSANGLGFVGLGENRSENLRDLWSYDSETDEWIKRSNFPIPQGLSHAVTFTISSIPYEQEGVGLTVDNLVFIGTGRLRGGVQGLTNQFWAYVPPKRD